MSSSGEKMVDSLEALLDNGDACSQTTSFHDSSDGDERDGVTDASPDDSLEHVRERRDSGVGSSLTRTSR